MKKWWITIIGLQLIDSLSCNARLNGVYLNCFLLTAIVNIKLCSMGYYLYFMLVQLRGNVGLSVWAIKAVVYCP